MRTAMCEMLEIYFALPAFSHCDDVVAAVTNAGGFDVLGASSHGPGDLKHELAWIDDHIHGKPDGVGSTCPDKFEGKDQSLTPEQITQLVAGEHRAYVADIFGDHGRILAASATCLGTPCTLSRAAANAPAIDSVGERLSAHRPPGRESPMRRPRTRRLLGQSDGHSQASSRIGTRDDRGLPRRGGLADDVPGRSL